MAGQECGRQWGRAAAGPSSARRARGLRRSDRGPIGGRAPGRSHHSKGDISKEFTWGHFHGVATRHHPRLAQEIASFGVPTKGKCPLVLEGFSGGEDHIVGLSGVIARSHGADVRSFLPFLESHFDIRQYKGVHPVFLMALLRVADYLQVEADRAPAQVLQVKQLASPASQGEWQAHNAIKDVRHTHEDPEALFVDAMPSDVHSFFRIEEWLRGIQRELDLSWAVLGEVYGRYEGLNRLGLVLRRIRSSLDDPAEFSKKVAYLPLKAAFRGSDADLLKLLIEPLYGNRPEVGLRELIQNAVDAVRELAQYQKDVPAASSVPLPQQEGDVIVSIEKRSSGEAWIAVADHGIGMSPGIIIEYFLTAGASFRRSETWRRAFETTDGKSKILRAGRFGIGALASFLLGPEVEVSTRHVEEIDGVQFRASVDSDSIELRKASRPVGTTIRIRVQPALAESLGGDEPASKRLGSRKPVAVDWDWYCLSTPSVIRRTADRKLEQKYHLPGPNEDLPPEWRRISHPDYSDVLWTYSEAPLLSCNGIEVARTGHGPFLAPGPKWDERFGLAVPKVAVFDPDGRLPLNLQRTGLTEPSYPFDAVLAEDVMRDFIAYSLVFGPTSVQYDGPLVYAGSSRQRPGRYELEKAGDLYFGKEGFGYSDASILQSLGAESLLIVRGYLRAPAIGELGAVASGPKILLPGFVYAEDPDRWLRSMVEHARNTEGSCGGSEWANVQEPKGWNRGGEYVLDSLRRRGARLLISHSVWTRAQKHSRLPKKPQSLAKQ